MDAHRLDAGARPRRPAPLGLEPRGGPRLRGLPVLPRHARRPPSHPVPDRPGREGAGIVELRERAGAGLRRVAGRRPGFVAACFGLYAVAAIVATEPAIAPSRSHFMAGGAPGHGEAAPGDHLQTGYHLWLPGDQL